MVQERKLQYIGHVMKDHRYNFLERQKVCRQTLKFSGLQYYGQLNQLDYQTSKGDDVQVEQIKIKLCYFFFVFISMSIVIQVFVSVCTFVSSKSHGKHILEPTILAVGY